MKVYCLFACGDKPRLLSIHSSLGLAENEMQRQVNEGSFIPNILNIEDREVDLGLIDSPKGELEEHLIDLEDGGDSNTKDGAVNSAIKEQEGEIGGSDSVSEIFWDSDIDYPPWYERWDSLY